VQLIECVGVCTAVVSSICLAVALLPLPPPPPLLLLLLVLLLLLLPTSAVWCVIRDGVVALAVSFIANGGDHFSISCPQSCMAADFLLPMPQRWQH